MTSERNGDLRYRWTPQGLVAEVGYSYFAGGKWHNAFRRAIPADFPGQVVGLPNT